MRPNARGSYFGGLGAALQGTRIDDLPPVPAGYESIAAAADAEMIDILARDLVRHGDR